MAEPAPYGGLMTKPLEDEKLREAKLKEQQIEVSYNGSTEILRPEALKIRGVDNLSTDEITSFLDFYLNYTTVDLGDDGGVKYEMLDNQVTFKVEWINDSSVGIAFQTHEDCRYALRQLSTTPSNPAIQVDEPMEADLNDQVYISGIIQERETKSYNPVLAFRKQQSLFARLGIEKQEKETVEIEKMEEDETSIVLYVRQAFQSDRKVKNAALYSRYYLIHGEPDRRSRYRRERRDRRQERDDPIESEEPKIEVPEEPKEPDEPEVDLFADRMASGRPSRFKEQTKISYNQSNQNQNKQNGRRNRIDEEEEDLFAHKMRDRSPDRRSRSPSRY